MYRESTCYKLLINTRFCRFNAKIKLSLLYNNQICRFRLNVKIISLNDLYLDGLSSQIVIGRHRSSQFIQQNYIKIIKTLHVRMIRTPWERGRLKTHEYTSIRMSLALSVWSRAKTIQRQNKRDRYSSDSGSDSDDDDTPPKLKLITPTLAHLASQLGQHHQALSIGEVTLDGPRLLDVTDIEPGQFYELTAFTLDGFLQMVDLHTKLPDVFCSTTTRHKCSKQIGLFICLLR